MKKVRFGSVHPAALDAEWLRHHDDPVIAGLGSQRNYPKWNALGTSVDCGSEVGPGDPGGTGARVLFEFNVKFAVCLPILLSRPAVRRVSVQDLSHHYVRER